MFGIFRLGYLFYPWGFIVQPVAGVGFPAPQGFPWGSCRSYSH